MGASGTVGLGEHVQKHKGNESQIGAELPGMVERPWLQGSHVDLLLDVL